MINQIRRTSSSRVEEISRYVLGVLSAILSITGILFLQTSTFIVCSTYFVLILVSLAIVDADERRREKNRGGMSSGHCTSGLGFAMEILGSMLPPLILPFLLSYRMYLLHDKSFHMDVEESFRATQRFQAVPEIAKRCQKCKDACGNPLVLSDVRKQKNWEGKDEGRITMWCPNCQSYGTYADNFMDLLHKYRD